MATFAFDAHLKLVLASFVPWLIICCCYGPILSLLIRRFLDSQSFSNLYFNSHIKHNTAVLLFLVLSLSIISEALPEGLTFHSLALTTGSHQRLRWAASLKILSHPWVLCPKAGNFPKVKRAPFTDGATGQHIQAHTAQLHPNANNRCFIPVRGFTNHAVFNS